MKTYVVIPHYIVTEELKELATNTIRSFKESADVVVVSVDDGSPMDTTFLKELSDVYIRNDQNSGFAITCNNGFKWVFENEPDDCYIICANNDIEVNKRSVPELIRPFNMFDNVAITGICSAKVREVENVPIEDYQWRKMSDGGLLGERMQDGGLWCSTKSVLEKIGIFDEQFIRGGYEDVDLFLRARDVFHMKIVMSGYAWYWHKQGATRWNCEQNGFINNFGHESKSIELDNRKKFLDKWGMKEPLGQLWKEIEIHNNV